MVFKKTLKNKKQTLKNKKQTLKNKNKHPKTCKCGMCYKKQTLKNKKRRKSVRVKYNNTMKNKVRGGASLITPWSLFSPFDVMTRVWSTMSSSDYIDPSPWADQYKGFAYDTSSSI
jgi:hypothetical protein